MGHVCRRGLAVIGALTANVMTAMAHQPALLIPVRNARPWKALDGVHFALMTARELALSCPQQWFESPRGGVAT